MAEIISGTEISKKVKESLKEEAAALKEKGAAPGLATVLVGGDPASAIYVKNKIKSCGEVGIESFAHHLDEGVSQTDVLSLLDKLNADPKVNGILVQLPLPKQLAAEEILTRIRPEKDVDGFHPVNVYKLYANKNLKEIEASGCLLPCTPHGILVMLQEAGIDPSGKHAVIVGRSTIVGKPMQLLLMACNATVTVCHSRTKNINDVIRQGDIVVAAMGVAKFVKKEMVKEGAVVIDVGMNRGEDGKLCGDVDFEAVKDVAAKITPVPGGVGPMTIAMLMKNTVRAAKVQNRCE